MEILPFHLGSRQIFPLLGRFFFADQFGVVTDGRIVDVYRRPVTVGVFEFRNKRPRFRRAIGHQQFGVSQSIHFADRHDIEIPAAGPAFGDDPVQRLLAAGANDLAFDAISLFEIVEQRFRLGDVSRRVPIQFAFLLRRLDQLGALVALAPRQIAVDQQNNRRQTNPPKNFNSGCHHAPLLTSWLLYLRPIAQLGEV